MQCTVLSGNTLNCTTLPSAALHLAVIRHLQIAVTSFVDSIVTANTVQCSEVLCNTVQCSAVMFNTVQCSALETAGIRTVNPYVGR